MRVVILTIAILAMLTQAALPQPDQWLCTKKGASTKYGQYDFTMEGTTGYMQDRCRNPDGAMSFARAEADHVKSTNNALKGATDFTVMLWVRMTRMRVRGANMALFQASMPNDPVGLLISTGNFRRTLKLHYNGQDFDGTYMPVMRWLHVAITLKGDQLTMWRNGQAQRTMTVTPSSLTDPTIYIGELFEDGVRNADYGLLGTVNDIRIFRHAVGGEDLLAYFSEYRLKCPCAAENECETDSDCSDNAAAGPTCAACQAGKCVIKAQGTVCRAKVGICDPAPETCDGVSKTCPAEECGMCLGTCCTNTGSCQSEMCLCNTFGWNVGGCTPFVKGKGSKSKGKKDATEAPTNPPESCPAAEHRDMEAQGKKDKKDDDKEDKKMMKNPNSWWKFWERGENQPWSNQWHQCKKLVCAKLVSTCLTNCLGEVQCPGHKQGHSHSHSHHGKSQCDRLAGLACVTKGTTSEFRVCSAGPELEIPQLPAPLSKSHSKSHKSASHDDTEEE